MNHGKKEASQLWRQGLWNWLLQPQLLPRQPTDMAPPFPTQMTTLRQVQEQHSAGKLAMQNWMLNWSSGYWPVFMHEWSGPLTGGCLIFLMFLGHCWYLKKLEWRLAAVTASIWLSNACHVTQATSMVIIWKKAVGGSFLLRLFYPC